MIFFAPGEILATALIALLLDRWLGDPPWLTRRIGHPVIWIGRVIGFLEQRLNRAPEKSARGRFLGLLTVTMVAALALAGGTAVILLGQTVNLAIPFAGLAAGVLLCQRSLADHVTAVADGLRHDVAGGRQALAHLVGRDVSDLDESAVATGAIESLAENTSDGIVAPLFWLLVGGLPGMTLYKAINTADSMIGHRDRRHLAFGWAAARLDDGLNLPAARLTAVGFALAAGITQAAPLAALRAALRAAWRDAGGHLSPNAGWPEAAVAGALGLTLGGPRSYAGRSVDLARMGDGQAPTGAPDIMRALALYRATLNLTTCLVAGALALLWAFGAADFSSHPF
ncbi:MAG: adenosylcobinamide-phosphate synthase CbiB [Pseudomonadota bacterium]|nr:adenosylcobinamide-phosphate synthase CbiB [Pseudomonadota bacterium]